MNEIEKLYENAGVKKINTHQSEIDNGDPRFTGVSHSDSYIKYPPFTAEKQIELIKWLAKNQQGFCLDYWIGKDGNNWECSAISEWEVLSISENFEEALTGFINALWQDLTKKEKQQIKEILE